MPIAYSLPQIPTTPLGALSGFYRGQQYDLAMQDAEKDFRNKDITNNRLENLYQNELLDNPMKEQERAKKIADAIYEQDLINSGAKRDKYDSEVTQIKSNTRGQDLINQEREITLASNALTQASALPELAKEAMWEDLRKDLTAKKIKFPPGPYSVENSQILKQQAEASLMTVKQLQEIQKKQIEFGYDMGKEAFKEDAAWKRAKLQADSHLQAAKINADALKMQALDRDAVGKAYKEMAENGGAISTETAIQVATATIKEDALREKLENRIRDDLVKNQTRDKPLTPTEMSAIAKREADKQLKEILITTGLNATKGKLKQSEVDKIAKTDPEFAKKLKESGRVIEEKSQAGSPTSTPTSTPTATTTTNVLAQAQARFDANPDGAIKALADSQFGGDLAKAKAKYQADGINTSKASMTPQEYAAKFSQGPTLKNKGLTGATPETILADSPRNE